MSPRTHSLLQCLKRRPFSFPHRYRVSTRTRRFNTLEPVASISDIENRCQTSFSRKDFQIIAWVGVFGSFALGNQTRSSDVDLLLGFRQGVSQSDINRMGDVTGMLQDVMNRDVDVVHMRYNQTLDYMRAQALLCSQTVYGSDQWRRDHQPLARRLLLDTHARFNAALRLGKEIVERGSPVTEKKELFEAPTIVDELVSDLDKLIRILRSDCRETAGINAHFEEARKWTSRVSPIVERYKVNGLRGLDLEDREVLWETLTITIGDNSASLERVYIPLLEELFETTAVDYPNG